MYTIKDNSADYTFNKIEQNDRIINTYSTSKSTQDTKKLATNT